MNRLRPDVVGIRPLANDLGELRVELVEPLAQGREREAVCAVLGLEPAGADAELGPPARDPVDGDGALRQHGRAPERDRRDHRPEPDPLRARRQRGEHRPGLERSVPWIAPEREVVVGGEEALEPGALDRPRQLEPALPRDAVLPVDHQADAHAAILEVSRPAFSAT